MTFKYKFKNTIQTLKRRTQYTRTTSTPQFIVEEISSAQRLKNSRDDNNDNDNDDVDNDDRRNESEIKTSQNVRSIVDQMNHDSPMIKAITDFKFTDEKRKKYISLPSTI